MKKVAILLAALTVASASYAKEIMPVAEMAPVMTVAHSDMYLNARFGGDFGANYDSISAAHLTDSTDGFGGEVALEGYKSLNDAFDIGLGLAYQFHADRDSETFIRGRRTVRKADGAEYDSIPLYLTAKYNFMTNSNIKPYLKANLGYSFNFNSSDSERTDIVTGTVHTFNTSVDDGLYWGAGVGMEYNNLTLDLMYVVNEAKTEINGANTIKEDNNYDRVVLSVGYIFDL